jgi:hypothetical protein
VLPETDMEYFGDDGVRMQMMFNLHVDQHLFYAPASAGCRPLAKAISRGACHRARIRDPLARPGRRRVLVTISR